MRHNLRNPLKSQNLLSYKLKKGNMKVIPFWSLSTKPTKKKCERWVFSKREKVQLSCHNQLVNQTSHIQLSMYWTMDGFCEKVHSKIKSHSLQLFIATAEYNSLRMKWNKLLSSLLTGTLPVKLHLQSLRLRMMTSNLIISFIPKDY